MTDKGKDTLQKDHNGLTEEEFLAAYEPGDYLRPSVATDMVIFTITEEKEENYREAFGKKFKCSSYSARYSSFFRLLGTSRRVCSSG